MATSRGGHAVKTRCAGGKTHIAQMADTGMQPGLPRVPSGKLLDTWEPRTVCQPASPLHGRVARRESSAAHAWAAGKAMRPTRGLQGKSCSPRTRAAWLRGSPPKPRCFGGFIFGGFAGRQSEVLSVLGVSASSLPASVACPLSLCFPSLARARARSLCARKSACECVWVRFCACLWRGAFASARVPTTRPMRCRSYLPSRPTPLCTL